MAQRCIVACVKRNMLCVGMLALLISAVAAGSVVPGEAGTVLAQAARESTRQIISIQAISLFIFVSSNSFYIIFVFNKQHQPQISINILLHQAQHIACGR